MELILATAQFIFRSMQTITIQLADEVANRLAGRVASGEFPDISTAINHKFLEEEDLLDDGNARSASVQELVLEAEEDFANGQFTEYDSAGEFMAAVWRTVKNEDSRC